MFGGGAKKKQPTKARHAGASLPSFGLIDVPGTDEFGNISLDHEDDDDDDLQAELHAIAYGNSKARKPAKKKQLVSENQLQELESNKCVSSCTITKWRDMKESRELGNK